MGSRPQRTAQTPPAWLQNAFRVGILGLWESGTSAWLSFVGRKKNHTCCLGQWQKAGFSSHLEVFLLMSPHPQLKKGRIIQHILDLSLGLFGV